MIRRAHVVVAAAGVLGSVAALASCSLGLDHSLIGRADAGLSPTDGPLTESGGDAGDDGPPPIMPEGGVCATDTDCMGASDTCVKPRCDVPRKACVFDVCKPAACTTSACDTTTRTCAAPKTHKFLAAQFPVGAGVGCGGSARACIAAVFPYVLVGTPNGVLAFAADDPGSTTPAPVSVTGLGFVPGLMFASGSRVYFLGAVTGAGASSRLEIGYLDVPPDPFRRSLTVTTLLASYNRSTGEPGFAPTLLPRANDTALLLDSNAAQSFPCTPVEPPLVEPLMLGSAAIPFTAGTAPVVTSGTRLMMATYDGVGGGSFGLIANAGGTATNGGQVPITGTPISQPASYAVDPQGGVFWMIESLSVPPNILGSYVKSVKGYFLLADGMANFDFTAGVDLETYPAAAPPIGFGPGAALVGPAAMIDTKTALVATAASNNASQTNIQIALRQPLGLVAGKKQLLAMNAVGTLGASASGGYGYVLASESATASSVYVFDPACAP
jgi:hypothetical protein